MQGGSGFVSSPRRRRQVTRRVLVLTAAVGLGISALIFAPGVMVEYDLGSAAVSANDRLSAINSIRNIILQVFGGLIVFFGAYVAWRRLALSEARLLAAQDAQVTDRYAKAVEQLGNLSLDIRLGGTCALERIARNSAVDMGPIIEILGAFVRGRSPWPPRIPGQFAERAPIDRTYLIFVGVRGCELRVRRRRGRCSWLRVGEGQGDGNADQLEDTPLGRGGVGDFLDALAGEVDCFSVEFAEVFE